MQIFILETLHRIVVCLVCCITIVLSNLSPTAVKAEQMEVDVQLVLAVDVSRSMSPLELEIQRRGYAEALVSEEVISAIQGGLLGQVAITYVEWAGTYSQRIVVDWSLISNRAEAMQFANKLTAHFEDSLRRTSISGGLEFAAALFEQNNFVSNRRIIDISGDGPNNQGRPVVSARDDVLENGIVINGLPLMTRDGVGSFFNIDDLDEYYRNCVIGGPGSFVIPVLSWEQFPTAVRQKLVQELAINKYGHISAANFADAVDAAYDCLIGEKLWQLFRGQMLFLP